MANKRIHFGVYQAGLAPDGVPTFTSSHAIYGLQSCGLTSRFGLEDVFEIGQLETYEISENIPEVEAVLEKALDGAPLIYHLATRGSTTNTIAGRSNPKAGFAMSIFSDAQDSASGTPLTTVFCSGMFTQALAYNFPVEGFATEQVTLIGNNKRWGSSITFNGQFNNNDSPDYSGGTSRRWHIRWAPTGTGVGQTTYTKLPTLVEGISSSGTNNRGSDGQLSAHIQRINVSANLGREQMLELGRRGPYHRYVTFPVQVRCDIELNALTGDTVNLLEEGYYSDGTNLRNETITVKSEEGIYLDLGTKNKLSSVSFGGANAGTRGGNATETYSFQNNNSLRVAHPADPDVFQGY